MAISLDIRQRIIKAWKQGTFAQAVIAERLDVSLGFVKKIIQQYRHTGSIEPLHHRAGRKRIITAELEERLCELIREQPDATLAELRERLGVDCTIQTIHYALKRIGESYKKKARRARGAESRGRQGGARKMEAAGSAS